MPSLPTQALINSHMVSLPRVKRFSYIPYIHATVELGVIPTALTDLFTHLVHCLLALQYYSHVLGHLRKPAFFWKLAQASHRVKCNRGVHLNIASASSLAISAVDPV